MGSEMCIRDSARAFCHEIDHLAGHMYVERVEDGLHDVEPPEEEVE